MASGFGLNGNVGRCYKFWQDFSKVCHCVFCALDVCSFSVCFFFLCLFFLCLFFLCLFFLCVWLPDVSLAYLLFCSEETCGWCGVTWLWFARNLDE